MNTFLFFLMTTSSFLYEDEKKVSHPVVTSDIFIEDITISSKNRKENNIITPLTISVSDKLAEKNCRVCINPLYKGGIFQLIITERSKLI